MSIDKFIITKASGEEAYFSEKKLRTSLQRSGANEDEIDRVMEEILPKLFPGIPTKKIYKMAFSLLKDSSRHLAARYHLKRAIMELGPSGFPFEKYIAEILKHQGYTANTGVITQGHCVKHEIDVLAQINDLQILIECKYHNQPGTFSDVKVPLYIQSRFKDIEAEWLRSTNESKKYQAWVVTNTRFSEDAIQYGTCSGLKMLGWDYPSKNSLKEQIDELGLYPITCLTSMTKNEKQLLLDKKIVLCMELNEKILGSIGIKAQRINTVMMETHQLCKNLVKQKTTNHVYKTH